MRAILIDAPKACPCNDNNRCHNGETENRKCDYDSEIFPEYCPLLEIKD